MAKTQNIYDLDEVLSPEAKDSLKHLELYARRKVDGILHGIHTSRRIGVSTDFDHHKEYQAGDPLKHMDWKVSARQERYYVKRFIEDSSLTVRMVVDRSASMLQSTDGPSKYLQACRMAACLGYLILKEKDSAGLVLAAEDETLWLPAKSSSTHLVTILQNLVARDAAAPDGLQPCLKAILDRAERKGLIVVISDLMFDPEPVQRELARLQAYGHEVLILQLRDETEEEFPFNRWIEFGDLENASTRHRLDAIPLKKIYREEYQALLGDWKTWSKKYNAHFVSALTSEHIETALSEYLVWRHRGHQE
ncbi:MAG: DUF58 domain-containing protein [Planctomycetota bacterium]|jgi:uncharacterized protein (DUF58 family)|nr:DUF58 domain-containing protein [Planctomycetota bacterium]MDP6504573.1 DUF58 domain-containing protein [Planctomycetota bacterium]